MRLRVLPCSYSVCRSNTRPEFAGGSSPLNAVLFDGKAYTWIGPQDLAPDTNQKQSGFRALEVEGPLDFNLTGVIAGISSTLARAGVPIFVLSSYDTDYLLVRSKLLSKAISALEEAGYQVAH